MKFEQGELVTLLGANGAGKTTTLKTLSGLLRPARGSVELEGKALHRIDAHEIVRRGVAHVPEGRKVFPRFTVLENLKIGGYARPKSALAPELDFVFQMFPRLKERQKQYAGTLSGGEQQMLAIARALMAKPKLLLLDEPSMGLAPKIVEQILENIRDDQYSGRYRLAGRAKRRHGAGDLASRLCVGNRRGDTRRNCQRACRE